MEEKMKEEIVIKPIGLPLSMLSIVDSYATKNNKSRALVVREALKEFIFNHNLSTESV